MLENLVPAPRAARVQDRVPARGACAHMRAARARICAPARNAVNGGILNDAVLVSMARQALKLISRLFVPDMRKWFRSLDAAPLTAGAGPERSGSEGSETPPPSSWIVHRDRGRKNNGLPQNVPGL